MYYYMYRYMLYERYKRERSKTTRFYITLNLHQTIIKCITYMVIQINNKQMLNERDIKREGRECYFFEIVVKIKTRNVPVPIIVKNFFNVKHDGIRDEE